jgi:DNA-binding transcriptional LysR family regulator
MGALPVLDRMNLGRSGARAPAARRLLLRWLAAAGEAARHLVAPVLAYGAGRIAMQYHRLDRMAALEAGDDQAGLYEGEIVRRPAPPKPLHATGAEASNDSLLNRVEIMKRVDPLAGITVFLTLAELKSFAATAARLKISAATVSGQIADLEERLGVRLVHRTTRHVTLTEAGEAYRASLDGLLEQAERGSSVVSSFKDEVSGTLRIAAPLDAESWLLGPAIQRFRRDHPELVIDLEFSHSVVDLVEHGFDLAIRGAHALVPNWIVRKIKSVEVFVAASPAYLATRVPPQQPRDIAGLDCLHYSGLSFGNVWQLIRDGVSESVPIRPALLSNAGSTLRQWALAGHGLALLPDFYIGEDIAAGRLVRVLPEWSAPGFDLNMVYPDNKHISRKVKLFVDTVIETTRQGEAA